MKYKVSPDKTILIVEDDNGRQTPFIPSQLQLQIDMLQKRKDGLEKQKADQEKQIDDEIAKRADLLKAFDAAVAEADAVPGAGK
jgi:hypothetical protein